MYHKKLAQDLQGGEIPLYVVESPVARTLGAEGEDYEIRSDQARLETLTKFMQGSDFETDFRLGTGNPASELTRMINELGIDMVIVGSHGHAGISDPIHGAVIDHLRYRSRPAR